MSGTYQLDGQLFPRNPLSKRWGRRPVGRRGTREPIFTGVWRLEMDFGVLETMAEHSFFMNRFRAGGLYTAALPHPDSGQLTTFTGISIEEYSADFTDIDSDYYARGARLILGVDLQATGTM